MGKTTGDASPPTELALGSDKLYFKIGEVAEIVGVPAYVLRYWESEFRQVRPQKSRSQQRVYRRRDVETLLRIKHLLHAQKFTIAGARQQLKEAPERCPMATPSGAYVVRQSAIRIRERLVELRSVIEDETTQRTDPAAWLASAGGIAALEEGAKRMAQRERRGPQPRASLRRARGRARST